MALTETEALRLASYKTAYDAVITGKSRQTVRNAEGASISYHPGNASLLKQEIELLEAKQATAGARQRGAIGFVIR